jgi:Zn-finger nucleic acid-binding protein
MRCPRDGAEATLETASGPRRHFHLDVCPKCGGAFFDKGEITKISGDPEFERKIVDYAAGPSELTCPRCGREMAKRPVGDVTLDVCRKCRGVWVDSGELETAAGTLRGESAPMSTSNDMIGLARAALMAHAAFGPTATLRLVLNPTIKRTVPEDL